MVQSHSFFRKMVDELVEYSRYDPELADGIKWIDKEFVQTNKFENLYDAVFDVMYRHDIKLKAKQWLRDKDK